MRIVMVTSFPLPGEYDGTAMLPIKIMRALKARGVEVVHAHLRARPPWGRLERGDFEGSPSFTLPPATKNSTALPSMTRTLEIVTSYMSRVTAADEMLFFPGSRKSR